MDEVIFPDINKYNSVDFAKKAHWKQISKTHKGLENTDSIHNNCRTIVTVKTNARNPLILEHDL